MIRVNAFAGMAPKIGPQLLQDNQAQVARNVMLGSGDIRPCSLPSSAAYLDAIASSIFKTRAGVWLARSVDTEWVEAPIVEDTYNRVYFTGQDGAFVSSPTIWSSGAGNLPRVSYTLGQPAPVAAPSVVVNGAPGGGSPETRYYVYTRVSIWGEESPPSPLSAQVTVELGQTVTVDAFVAAGAGYVPTAKYRIYRTSTGITSTSLLYVGETTGAPFVDSVATSALGAAITSIEYDPPPAGLRQLEILPGGILAGVVGRYVYFSEPWYPHAWPIRYRQALDVDAVAVGGFGNTVVVATKGRPYLMNGSHPDSYIPMPEIGAAPCASAKSFAVTPVGILWATVDGLYGAGPNGTGLITDKMISSREWYSYWPSSMAGVPFAGGYAGAYTNGVYSGIVALMPDAGLFDLSISAKAVAYTPDDNAIYYLEQDGRTIRRLAAEQGNAIAEWKSKLFITPPVNMHYLRVSYDASALSRQTIEIPGLVDDATLAGAPLLECLLACDSAMPYSTGADPSISIAVYGDGELVSKESVHDEEPIPFACDGMPRNWHFVANTNVPIREIAIAPDIEGVL